MISEKELLSKMGRVTTTQLRMWVSQQWVRPARSDKTAVYNQADLARCQLLDLLDNELEVGSEAIPIILSLIDQMHDLRARMRTLAAAIEEQPDEVRIDIVKCARKRQ